MRLPYIIAEIGVNYYDIARLYEITPLEAALLMVDNAHKSGANAAKFQTYKAEKIASRNSPSYWDTSKESTTNQFDLFSKYDKFNEEDYIKIANHCNKIGIDFLSTPFDLDSVDFLDHLVKLHKISSSDITNYPLLKKVAKTGKKILLSTGASTIQEVGKAVEVIKLQGNSNIVLLHCILNYPTDNKNAHLRMIEDLKQFGYEVGYSDHTLPDSGMIILTTSVMLGATYIEKHFTLDKSIPGNDHYHAMDPSDLQTFIQNLKVIEEVLGSSTKNFLPTEEISRQNARRGIYTSRNLLPGEVVTEKDIICKRPALGIPANEYDLVIGKTLNQKINEDQPIFWKNLN